MMEISTREQVQEYQEAVRRFAPPYLMRQYEATLEDYERITDEDFRCEFLDGVLVVHSPATLSHEDILLFLAFLVRGFVEKGGTGSTFGSNAVMQLGRRRFCPDLSFLHRSHFDRIRKGQVAGPMDLVVELLSKSTRDYDLREKRAAYREGLVPEIWLIDPERREFQADVLTMPRNGTNGSEGPYQSEILREGRWSSRVLDGFWIDVGWLWSEPLPNALDCFQKVIGSRIA